MYSNAPLLTQFHSRIAAAAGKITRDIEIILVNDASPDNSLEMALKLLDADARVKIIDLSANFGHHKAIMTGLRHATGDLVFLIDSDLEEPPELLELMHAKFMEDPETDVVYGVQKYRKGATFEKLTGWAFYKIINSLADLKVPASVTTARIMSRRYVDSLLQFREKELFLAGVMQAAGYKQVPLELEKLSSNKSTYTFSRKVNLTLNAVTSFSAKPLLIIFYTGMAISLTSGLCILYLLYLKLFFNVQKGWTSMIASTWFLGGFTIFSIGVIGVYLSKAFNEIKDRPYTIVKQIYERNENEQQ